MGTTALNQTASRVRPGDAATTHAASAGAPGYPALGRPNVVRESRPDGSFVLRSAEPLQPFDARIGDWLLRWAEQSPDAVFLAERVTDEAGNPGWRRVSYAQALTAVRCIAQWLLKLPGEPRPVAALSDNSVNLALLSLAAMHVGRPMAAVSPSYVKAASTYDKAHAILRKLQPAVLYAEDSDTYGKAIESAGLDAMVVYTTGKRHGSIAFDDLLQTTPTAAVEAAYAGVTPETVAKLLFTSGSTGIPKAVLNTHRMLCANQQMIAQCWPFLHEAPPVVLDWLPWSHTFGANHNFNMVLRNGGALYIDDGRPVPALVERTVRNIEEVRPTLYFNVPRGFDALLPHLEAKPAFAAAFFERLDALFYAAAALPPSTWRRLAECAKPHRKRPLFFTTAWGATETSPLITSAHFPIDQPANIGVPAPGLELKFVPTQDKLELRVRGVSIFSGYLDDPEKTAAAFDEEGFYKLGDAGRLVDPDNPSAGVLFDGRVAEDFKLSTGTWVSVGSMRVRALSALATLAQDIVVAGHDRDEIGFLLFASPALRALAGDTQARLDGATLGEHPAVRSAICQALEPLYQDAGSSQRARRVRILVDPPSLDVGEITDKGYVNQGVVLAVRADEVEALFDPAAKGVIPIG